MMSSRPSVLAALLAVLAAAGCSAAPDNSSSNPDDPLNPLDPSKPHAPVKQCAFTQEIQVWSPGLAVDATHLYWATWGESPGTGAILKADKHTCEQVTLAQDLPDPLALAIDETSVYWLTSTAVMRAPKEGGAPVEVATHSGSSYQGGLTVDDTHVYIATESRVQRAPKAGGEFETLTQVHCGLSSVVVDGSHVYFSSDGCSGHVMRAPKEGGDAEVIAIHQYSRPLAVDDTQLYRVRTDFGAVSAAPKAGGGGRVLSFGGHHAGQIAIDATRVYYHYDEELGSVMKSGVGEVVVAGPPSHAYGLVVDGERLYWLQADGIYTAGRPEDQAGEPPSGTGAVDVSWTIDRGQNCAQDAYVSLLLLGPTNLNTTVRCDAYGHKLEGLAPGSYRLHIERAGGSGSVGFDSYPFEVGSDTLPFEPLDLGICVLQSCSNKSVGCVDDGVCTAEDDCTCPDCANDTYCNPGPGDCPDDFVCTPYYEGCSCADCSARPECSL